MAETLLGCCTVGADHRSMMLRAENPGFCFYLGHKKLASAASRNEQNVLWGGGVADRRFLERSQTTKERCRTSTNSHTQKKKKK